jgi:hypothetical protein
MKPIGARWEDVYGMRDSGALVEISRGIHRVADAAATAHLDLLAVCRRVPDGMICLNSAASYWDLASVAPRGTERCRPPHRPGARAERSAQTHDITAARAPARRQP